MFKKVPITLVGKIRTQIALLCGCPEGETGIKPMPTCRLNKKQKILCEHLLDPAILWGGGPIIFV